MNDPETIPDQPDSANHFAVSSARRDPEGFVEVVGFAVPITLLNPIKSARKSARAVCVVLTREQALNLAAWIAALADPSGEEFARLRTEVETA